MAPAKKLPLQTSSNANVAASIPAPGKTIEETYQKKTQLEHILLRPDIYIGSIDNNNNEMVHRPITYVPGLYKIFDEILINAADNKQRGPSMDAVRVTIDLKQNLVSVYNSGDGPGRGLLKRLTICVSLSKGPFQQILTTDSVSFVNSIATIKGGTHVDYITNQITNHVMNIVNKKNKNANLKAHMVKNHLWIFVNALIDNPAFDSQTKETLTICQSSFGLKCELSQEFLKKEGDSAKALALAGISAVGRNYYGVFPLRGKLFNVWEASHKQIMENAEIQNIKQILGLQHRKEYDSVKSLRYGHLMIMTDQDHDGSHIKGLLIEMGRFYPYYSPCLSMNHGGKVWEAVPVVGLLNTIRFGLGTSTSKEGKEYFNVLESRRKNFIWEDEQDGEAIELAFIKKKIEARKNWLRHFEPGTYLDQKEKFIKCSDFVNKELILFSMANLQQSIPSMVEGLKPGQRKILFCSFKRNFVKEAKVVQFSGYVSEHLAYLHGEQSLTSTIIGMAQDYVGSNNINLLQPNGQFGTRHQHIAASTILCIAISYILKFSFVWYMPIIPMVQVNGSEGIGIGWSSYIANYSPRDIVANVRHLLNGEPMEVMDPWYKGFRRTIEKTTTKESGVNYTITGVIDEVNDSTLRISELPIRRWTQDYKEFLESMENDKIEDPFMKDYSEHNDDTTVQFEVILSGENMTVAKQEGLLKKFKLTTTISTSNMHLFYAKGVIKKYDNPEQILEDFFHIRLEFYDKRKKVLLDSLEMELLKLDNKVWFLLGVVKEDIIVSNRKRAELFIELQDKGFTPFPKKTKNVDVAVAGATDDAEEAEENSEVVAGSIGVRASDYEYLLSMVIGTLTLEKVQELCADRDKLSGEVDELSKATPKSLWIKDLDALERELDEQDKTSVQAEAARNEMKSRVMGEAGLKVVTRQALKNPRKNNNKKTDDAKIVSEAIETRSSSAMETDNVPEAAKPKGRAGPKKAPVRKQEKSSLILRDEDDDDEVLELKDRFAAYNLESSPDHSEGSASVITLYQEGMHNLSLMKVSAWKLKCTKHMPGRKLLVRKKNLSTVTQIFDDEEEKEMSEFEMIVFIVFRFEITGVLVS
ncbi:hypothetical protein RHMOL_Rhmol09G0124700 [Rhododendron molle]|uniref:Uncharacterized protein n=1 Tax=Rhododendron molle TaxID=49168 RepID=A0ACC0MDX4_RHOML|nr:hypothetical protein RHMOL_Rhmol09G0124700 [Rhododendron molle]